MKKDRVLLVDCDRGARQLRAVILDQGGFGVTQASDGQDALRKLPLSPHALIIANIDIPDMRGAEFLGRLRGDIKTSLIPVLFVVPPHCKHLVPAIVRAGADGVLEEPFGRRDLVDQAKEMLWRRGEMGPLSDLTGNMEEMPLSTLLRSMVQAGHSGTVEVTHHQEMGRIFVRRGQIVDAEAGRLRRERALFQLLSLQRGRFYIKFGPVARRSFVDQDSLALVEQASAYLQSGEGPDEGMIQGEAVLITHPGLLSNLALTPAMEEVSWLFHEGRTLAEALEMTSIDRDTTLAVATRLYYIGALVPSGHERSEEAAAAARAISALVEEEDLGASEGGLAEEDPEDLEAPRPRRWFFVLGGLAAAGLGLGMIYLVQGKGPLDGRDASLAQAASGAQDASGALRADLAKGRPDASPPRPADLAPPPQAPPPKLPAPAQAQLEEGEHLMKTKRHMQALEIFKEVLKDHPQCPQALAAMGKISMRRGRWLEGATYLRQALDLKPDEAEWIRALASANRAMYRIVAARSAYQEYLRVAPEGRHRYEARDFIRRYGEVKE